MNIKEIEEKCKANGLVFERGKFKNGIRYQIKFLSDDENIITWPCQNMSQCSMAITQASWLKDQVAEKQED